MSELTFKRRRTDHGGRKFLAGGGRMGGLIRGYDWTSTSLGPIEQWNPGLRAALSICINSLFPIGIVWGPDLICFYNDAFIPMLGLQAPHQSLGQPCHHCFENIWTTISPLIKDVYATGKAKQGEDLRVNVKRRGRVEEVYFTFSCSPIFDEAGEVSGLFMPFMETTRMKTEESLRKNAERFQRYFELGLVGMVVMTPDKTCMEVNDEMCKMLGYEREELLGRDLSQTTHPDDLLLVNAQAARIFSGEIESFSLDKRWIRKDGQVIETTVSVKCMRRKDGAVDYFVLLVRDVTAHKQAEKALRESEERLARLNAGLEQSIKNRTEELRQKEREFYQAMKLEAVGRLAGGVAHDFNNLIAGILGLGEEIQELATDTATRENATQVIESAHRAFEVTRQLLAFARRQVSQPVVLNVDEIIARIARLLKRLLGEDIAIHVVSGKAHPIKADRIHLEQVLMNLAVNARDAMPEGGMLRIRTSNTVLEPLDHAGYLDVPAGPYVVLEVADSGTGMTPEVLSHIFEPFFTTKDRDKGTGLGLSLVYGIVKQNGGGIKVETELGKGTSFKLFFPALPGERPVPDSLDSGTAQPRGSETLLLVEDDPVVRKVVVMKLKRAGYQVLEAANAQAALEFAKRHRECLQLLLTDVVMPDMDGKKLADQIRKIVPDIAVLFMSGYSQEIIAHRGVLDPGLSFIDKSQVGGGGLVNKVREVLDAHGRH